MRMTTIVRRALVGLAVVACGCPGGGDGAGATEGDTDDGPTGGAETGDGGTGSDPGEEIACAEHPLAPAATGTCEVTAPGSSGLRLRGTVLTPDGLLRAGEVLVDAAGTITCVDCDCSGAPGAADATVIACGDAVISPGLIDPHVHISYVNNAPVDPGQERYEHRHDWRRGDNGHTELQHDGQATADEMLAGEVRLLMGGATAAASAGGSPGLVRNVDVGGLAEGIALPVVDSEVFPLDDPDGTTRTQGCNYGRDPDTTASIASENAYLPHIAEGIGLTARNEFLCASQGAQDLIQPQTAIVQGIGLVAQDYARMQQAGTALVWSPRSNLALYGNTAAVTAMHRMGVSISLGSDWVITGSMNLLRELACADEFNRDHLGGYFSDRELWKMVTTNAAFAIGAEGSLGMLVPGAVADIAIFRTRPEATDHRAVVAAGVEDVVLVMRGGELLYGDDDVMSAAGAGECEGLDVCGTQKRICVTRDTGGEATLASVRAAIEDDYPLVACGVPQGEPSCVPWRPGEYAAGITDDDGDGDGVPDDADDCPTVFNPVRPLEQSQADGDQDGVGDVCDVCPLDPDDACTPPDPDDPDGDGIVHGVDNCPFLANPGQADADADGHGDECDDCPVANPGAGACPYSIAAIRDPDHPDHPPEGTVVTIAGAWVTGVRPDTGGSRAFYLQDDSGEPFSGLLVFTAGTSPGVQVGNRVRVSGTYEEYEGLTELTSPVVVVEDAGTVLPFEPIVVPPADIATGGMLAEAYECMLVQVEDVAITDANPDAPSDYDELMITGGLRLDDELSDDETGIGLGNDCPAGSEFSAVAGVLGYAFGDHKLLPRGPEDVTSTDCDPFSP